VTQTLAELRENLEGFYSEIGRPSIDPELMLRMLIVIQRPVEPPGKARLPPILVDSWLTP
jgi:hypothetical protein